MTTHGYTPPMIGLEPPQAGRDGPLLTAARATLAHLDTLGLMEPHHDLTRELVLALARAVDAGLAVARVSVATATLTRQLQDAIASLPAPSPVEAGDAFEALIRELHEVRPDAR